MKQLLPKAIFLAVNLFICFMPKLVKSQSGNIGLSRSMPPDSGEINAAISVSLRQDTINKYYALAKKYKDGDGIAIDYSKAFYYFSKAADLGDAQSIYAVAYLHYKGFGTTQDYFTASRLFSQGAYAGRDNSEYFLGLCFRNGYGLKQNEDSARYWLKKAAAQGYRQAFLELQTPTPENGNTKAAQLIEKIHNAAVPEQVPLNRFIPIQPQKPDSSIIAGHYEGYVIQYDWSGKYPVNTKQLLLTLQANFNQQDLNGKWLEEGADTVMFKAFLRRDSLVFDNTRYKRKDHYSPTTGIRYDFRNATLNMVRKGDSVYLAGNVYMFSPDRKEPSKPLFIALTRTAVLKNNDSDYINRQINSIADTPTTAIAKILSVYPNPFHNYINVEFRISKATMTGLDMYSMDGQAVYRQPPQLLNKGIYRIRIEPSSLLVQQTYILRLMFTNGQETVKIIKK